MRIIAGVLGIAIGLLGNYTVDCSAQPPTSQDEKITDKSENSLCLAGNGQPINHPLKLTMKTVETENGQKQIPQSMAFIPEGEFQFGSGRSAERVKLPAYCMGIFSVTNAEYQAFLKDSGQRRTPSYWKGGNYPEGKAAHPVVYVSLDDAKAYAKWMSDKTGYKFFIPTSQQWEHAARSPNKYLYPWGNSQDAYIQDGKLVSKFRYNAVTAQNLLSAEPKREVIYDNAKSPYHGQKMTLDKLVAYGKDGRETTFSVSSNGSVRGWVSHDTWTGFIYTDLFHSLTATGGDTSPVGSYESGKSGYGCYDMAGNVWNWCDTLITATNGAEKGKQVNEIRGGSWYANGNSCKSVSIGEGRAGKGAYNTVGFRIAMQLPDK